MHRSYSPSDGKLATITRQIQKEVNRFEIVKNLNSFEHR